MRTTPKSEAIDLVHCMAMLILSNISPPFNLNHGLKAASDGSLCTTPDSASHRKGHPSIWLRLKAKWWIATWHDASHTPGLGVPEVVRGRTLNSAVACDSSGRSQTWFPQVCISNVAQEDLAQLLGHPIQGLRDERTPSATADLWERERENETKAPWAICEFKLLKGNQLDSSPFSLLVVGIVSFYDLPREQEKVWMTNESKESKVAKQSPFLRPSFVGSDEHDSLDFISVRLRRFSSFLREKERMGEEERQFGECWSNSDFCHTTLSRRPFNRGERVSAYLHGRGARARARTRTGWMTTAVRLVRIVHIDTGEGSFVHQLWMPSGLGLVASILYLISHHDVRTSTGARRPQLPVQMLVYKHCNRWKCLESKKVSVNSPLQM